MSNSVTASQYLLSQSDLKLLCRIFNKYGERRPAGNQKSYSFLIHINITFENQEYENISNFIYLSSNLPLPTETDTDETVKKKADSCFLINNSIIDSKNSSSEAKLNERRLLSILAPQSESHNKNNEELGMKVKKIKYKRELLFWECATEYLKQKADDEALFIDEILKFEQTSKTVFNIFNIGQWIDASINFVLKSPSRENSSKKFEIQKLEIEIKKPNKYTYCFEKKELEELNISILFKGCASYVLYDSVNSNYNVEKAVFFLVFDCFCYVHEYMRNAFNHFEWLRDACNSSESNKENNNKKAVILMWLVSGRIFQTVSLSFSLNKNKRIKLYVSDVEKPFGPESFNPEEHVGKSIATLFGYQSLGIGNYNFYCCCLNPSLGKNTSSIISEAEKNTLGNSGEYATPSETSGLNSTFSDHTESSKVQDTETQIKNSKPGSLPTNKNTTKHYNNENDNKVKSRNKQYKFYWISCVLVLSVTLVVGFILFLVRNPLSK